MWMLLTVVCMLALQQSQHLLHGPGQVPVELAVVDGHVGLAPGAVAANATPGTSEATSAAICARAWLRRVAASCW
jgi:hypothetical protein